MKTLYLVRHGHIDNPEGIFYGPDKPLSSAGAKQMIAIAQEMQHDGIMPKRTIASPYTRVRESALVLSSALEGPEVELDNRLVEWQVGDWIGKPLKAFRSFVGYDEKPFGARTDGFESFAQMSERITSIVNDVLTSIADEDIAFLVGHREPLVTGMLTLQGKGIDEVPVVDFPRGAVWKLEFNDNKLVSAEKAYDHSLPNDPRHK